MILSDVIAGYYLPSSFGWIFLIFVILSEGLLLSRYLAKKWTHRKILLSVFIGNLITTIIGFLLLDEQKKGGHLLTWIPVENYHGHARIDRTLFLFASSFVGTVIVESAINLLVLMNDYNKGRIIKGTVMVNSFTYFVGGMVIVIYNIPMSM